MALQQHQKTRRLHWTLHGWAQLSYGRLRLAITTTHMIALLQFNQAQVCVCMGVYACTCMLHAVFHIVCSVSMYMYMVPHMLTLAPAPSLTSHYRSCLSNTCKITLGSVMLTCVRCCWPSQLNTTASSSRCSPRPHPPPWNPRPLLSWKIRGHTQCTISHTCCVCVLVH